MPTVLYINGGRFFFYSNEGKEPIHIHVQKAEKECKFWLNEKLFDIEEAYSYGMGATDKRQVRKIIFDHFDLILNAWKTHFKEDE